MQVCVSVYSQTHIICNSAKLRLLRRTSLKERGRGQRGVRVEEGGGWLGGRRGATAAMGIVVEGAD